MKLLQLKHLQLYMTNFELGYRKVERIQQRHQLSTIIQSTIEEVFGTMEKSYVDMSTSHSTI